MFDWITARVANTSASPGSSSVPYLLNSEPGLSLNQRLAKWQFIALDLNRNRVRVFLCYQNRSIDSTFCFGRLLFTIVLSLRYWKRGS